MGCCLVHVIIMWLQSGACWLPEGMFARCMLQSEANHAACTHQTMCNRWAGVHSIQAGNLLYD